MQESPELRALLVDYWRALSEGRLDFVQQHLSEEPELLGIGTDPDEWYQGSRLHEVWKAQLSAVGGVTVTPGDALAYREGSVGWLVDRPTFAFPNGSSFTARFTAVVHLEEGAWKFVQSHTSIAVPNEELVGSSLPT